MVTVKTGGSMDYKITQEEIEKNWVQSAPDQLRSNDSTVQDNKKIFDKLPLLICEKHNALSEYVKTDIYSKEETIQKINERVVEIGAGDMAQKVYDENNDGVVNAADNGIFEYTHSGDTLTGNGINGKFKATSAGNKASFTINGKSYSVKQGEETSIDLVTGVWYMFILDDTDNTINFIKGGAVSIPDGKTVTPVDNIKIWQKCAGLQTKYDNINNLLLDSNYVSALMSTDNSIQYMIRSLNIQTSVLSNISVVDILDRTLSFTTPTMTSANTPYGEVTFDRAPDSSWKDFRDDIGSDANYWTGIGGWVQWVHTTPFWMYKFRIYDMYTANNSTIRIDAILEDNSVVELSKNITVYNKKDIIEIMPAHTYKCKGFRIVKVAAPGENDWVNFTKIKAWGKL